eukprot:69193_1
MAQAMEIDEQQNKKTSEQKSNNKPNSDPIHAVRDNLIKILSTTSVSELQFAAKAIVLDSNLNPKKAIETLLQYKIRAAPVIHGDEFIGVLDLRDTVKYAFENYESKQINNDEFEAKHHLLS